MTLVAGVVVAWNRREDTLACLEALDGQVGPLDVRLVVVDNGSTDGTEAAVRESFPRADVVALPENVGYAAGANVGLRRALGAGARLTLLANNDAFGEPDAVRLLLGGLDGDGSVGMATPTIHYYDRPGEVWPSAGRRRRLTLAAFDTTAGPPSDEPYDVDWATGCFLLVRREVWDRIGLFDERYRFYYEDHDLCLRARRAGIRIVHVPRARVLHRVAASTGLGSPAQLYLLARASVPFYASHTRGAHRAVIAAYRLGSLVRTLARSAVDRRPAAGLAYARGLRDGLRDLRRGSGPDGR